MYYFFPNKLEKSIFVLDERQNEVPIISVQHDVASDNWDE